ncbi:hypothetical protein BH11MYX4_BH11MYX4_35590 [soil metagenome]
MASLARLLGGALPLVLVVACGSLKQAPDPTDDAGVTPTEDADLPDAQPLPEGGDAAAPVDAEAGAGMPVRGVSPGFKFACRTSFDGQLRCFGVGLHGALGVGTVDDSKTLVAPQVSGPLLEHAAADYRSCAVLTNGAVQCWGENRQGILGIGQLGGDRMTPQNITLPFGARHIALGPDQTLAVLQNGDLMGWGLNFDYQLGDGTQTPRYTPVKIPGLPKKAIAAASGFNASCAVLEDGQLMCWGLTGYLPFDAAVVGDHVMQPRVVAGLPDKAAAVSIGLTFGCARLEGGDVYCWGSNDSGQLGDGSTTDRVAPVRVKGLNDAAIALSLGGQSACALLASGVVRCWGANTSGQLGDPTKVPHSTPITVAAAANATAIGMGSGYGCAGFADGSLKCWGAPPLGVATP